MFKQIAPSAADPIMSLMEAYLQDPNPKKVNLGIGLYYDRQGNIPLMQAVEAAEQRLLALRRPHGYPPIEGSPQFARRAGAAVRRATGGRDRHGADRRRFRCAKAGGGFLRHFLARGEIWVSDPTGPITGRYLEAPGCR